MRTPRATRGDVDVWDVKASLVFPNRTAPGGTKRRRCLRARSPCLSSALDNRNPWPAPWVICVLTELHPELVTAFDGGAGLCVATPWPADGTVVFGPAPRFCRVGGCRRFGDPAKSRSGASPVSSAEALDAMRLNPGRTRPTRRTQSDGIACVCMTGDARSVAPQRFGALFWWNKSDSKPTGDIISKKKINICTGTTRSNS